MLFVLLCISCWKGFGKRFWLRVGRLINRLGYAEAQKWMRSRCQDTAKPMSGWMRSRCRKVRSRCHDNAKPMSRYCEADVKANAKPMSGLMRSRCHDNAKPMSRRSRSRCQDECEADVKATAKPMSRRHSPAHTPNGRTHAHKQIDAKWERTVRYVLLLLAMITSLPSISLAQYSITSFTS